MIPTIEHCHHCGVENQNQIIDPLNLNSRQSGDGRTYVDVRCTACNGINRHVLDRNEKKTIVPVQHENEMFMHGHLH